MDTHLESGCVQRCLTYIFEKLTEILFLFRAAQKLNLSASPHRRRRSGDDIDEQPFFPNGYATLIQKSPPPAPPALLRRIGVKELSGVGKVRDLFYLPFYDFDKRNHFSYPLKCFIFSKKCFHKTNFLNFLSIIIRIIKHRSKPLKQM